jgi:hypothetical protein
MNDIITLGAIVCGVFGAQRYLQHWAHARDCDPRSQERSETLELLAYMRAQPGADIDEIDRWEAEWTA